MVELITLKRLEELTERELLRDGLVQDFTELHRDLRLDDRLLLLVVQQIHDIDVRLLSHVCSSSRVVV